MSKSKIELSAMKSNTHIFTIIVSVFLIIYPVYGKDFNNGCGSGWNEILVPDTIKLLDIDYKQACAKHDNCYSKCLEGGENEDKEEECTEEEKEERRKICDDEFLISMNQSCKNNFVQKILCKTVGSVYKIAVRLGGSGSFHGKELDDLFIYANNNSDFDFSPIEREILELINLPGYEIDQKIQIRINDANVTAAIVPKSRPYRQLVTPAQVKSGTIVTHVPSVLGEDENIDRLFYGNVDITKTKINDSQIQKLFNNNQIQGLDLNKFSTIKNNSGR